MHNPFVPETLEGWSLLHQAFRIRWSGIRTLSPTARVELAAEAAAALKPLASGEVDGGADGEPEGDSILVQLLGHKGDLLVVHAHRTCDELSQAQLSFAKSRLCDHLEPTLSYVSMVELGMYEMTAKIHEQLAAQGLEIGSDAFDAAFD